MKIGIVGMGLIGASLGRAILKNTEHEIFGLDVDKDARLLACKLGAQTCPLTDADYGLLDMIVFALREGVAEVELERVCPLLKDGAIVIDTCGIKRGIAKTMTELEKRFPKLCFFATHPMAGREVGGAKNSLDELFDGAYFVVVPVSDDEEKLCALRELFFKIGARGVEVCSAERHDEMIAYTSQFAHVVSSCYVQNPLSRDHVGFSAGSFQDLTRVATLDPEMWTELFLKNKDCLLPCIEDFSHRLSEFEVALKSSDAGALMEFLKRGTECKAFSEGKK